MRTKLTVAKSYKYSSEKWMRKLNDFWKLGSRYYLVVVGIEDTRNHKLGSSDKNRVTWKATRSSVVAKWLQITISSIKTQSCPRRCYIWTPSASYHEMRASVVKINTTRIQVSNAQWSKSAKTDLNWVGDQSTFANQLIKK